MKMPMSQRILLKLHLGKNETKSTYKYDYLVIVVGNIEFEYLPQLLKSKVYFYPYFI